MTEDNHTSATGRSDAGNWRWWAPRLLAGAVGLYFLTAGVLKATDMELFIRQIRDYGIITNRAGLVLIAWGLIALECTLGVGLLILYRPRLTLTATGALLLVFLGATSWAWTSGATEDCGCFGAWIKRTPGEAALEDLLLLAILGLVWVGRRRLWSPPSRAKTLIITLACLLALALPVMFGFPISAITRPPSKAPGIELGLPQVQGLEQYDLTRGEYLVILMDTDCSHCQESVPQLNALAEASDLPPVVAICKNDEMQRMIFVDQYQPLFPIGQISETDFWRLLADGETPRLMLVHDQRVQQVWDRTVPSKEAIEKARSQ